MTTERMALLDKIIFEIKGTCGDLDEVAASFGISELMISDLCYIETEIFCCSNCGWWCEVCEGHDVDGETVCDDCY